LKLPFGGNTPFQAEVWFINGITKLDMKWGTPTPIQVEDPKYGVIIPIRAFGQYGIKVENPRLFLETLIGNMTSFTANTINEYFKGKLLSNLNTVVAKSVSEENISILDINTRLMEMSEFCQNEINKFLVKYGISLADFSVISVNVPQDDPSFIKLKEAKATATQFKITGKDIYQMQRSFDVLEKAAENTGTGSQLMGLGVGLGIGNVMTNIAGQTLNPSPQSAPAPPPLPPEQTYFVYIGGQQLAGQTAAQIATMRSQGMVNDDTLVWTAGMSNWMPIKSVPALAGACPPPIPPAPPV